MTAAAMTPTVADRATWRAVAVPSEHGGWGLTLEPVLLGLVVAWSIGGVAIGTGALTAFLVRTPLKLVLVDLRRGRWLQRTRVAVWFVIGESAVLVAAAAIAVTAAGWAWLVPIGIAAPLVGVETWFDARSRSRRQIPELCGAIAIAASAASIALAAGRSAALAAGLWLVLAARTIGAIPFVRVQIMRLRRGAGSGWHSDLAQLVGALVAVAAVVVDHRLAAGLVGVGLLGVVQTMWVRRTPVPAKVLGMRQMVMGLGLVVLTACGALL